MGQVENYKIENEYYRQLVSDRVRSDEALWQAIGACGLSFVYADGLPQSNVIMIGEAPGKVRRHLHELGGRAHQLHPPVHQLGHEGSGCPGLLRGP